MEVVSALGLHGLKNLPLKILSCLSAMARQKHIPVALDEIERLKKLDVA